VGGCAGGGGRERMRGGFGLGTSGDLWHTWREDAVTAVRSNVRDTSIRCCCCCCCCCENFQEQTCGKVDATSSSSQLLVANSTKIRHTALLTSS